MRLPTSVVLALVALATLVLIALGVWQLTRNEAKRDLARQIDAAIAAPPLGVAAALTAPRDEVEWHRVTVEGRWDLEHAQFVGNRTRFGLRGEEIVVPLVVADAPVLLVDRGWYPLGEREETLARLTSEQSVAVEGVARFLSGRSASLVDGAWTRLDPSRMGEALPYAEVAPFVVVAGEEIDDAERVVPDVRPVPGFEGYRNTTPHVEYALTWFGLAVALVVTASVRIARGNRPGRRAPDFDGTQEGSSGDGHEAA
jgi:surfeit locus 1 family protein